LADRIYAWRTYSVCGCGGTREGHCNHWDVDIAAAERDGICAKTAESSKDIVGFASMTVLASSTFLFQNSPLSKTEESEYTEEKVVGKHGSDWI
jgi:hypothetical protein